MKLLPALLMSMLTVSAVNTHAQNARPGAGVVENGQYKTFYSAGLYVEPNAQSAQIPVRIPAITKLESYVMAIPSIGNETKKTLMMAIMPTTIRQYMIADAKLLTPEVKARLIAEFQRVTGVDPSTLRLFALTDTSQKITYILPGFEKLTLDDQMSILFHEAYWILHSDSAYQEVVKAEMSFEAALKNPRNAAMVYDFVSHVGTEPEVYVARMKWEIGAGHLAGFVDAGGRFNLGKLLGAEYLNCLSETDFDVDSSDSENNVQTYNWTNDSGESFLSSRGSCSPYFRTHLTDLMVKYPKSQILQDLAKAFDSENSNVSIKKVGRLAIVRNGLFGRYLHDDYGCMGEFKQVAKTGDHGLSHSSNDVAADYKVDWTSLSNCTVSPLATENNVSCPSYSVLLKLQSRKEPSKSQVLKCSAPNSFQFYL